MPNEPLTPSVGPAGGPPLGRPPNDLKAERVQRELSRLPGWALTPDGGAISRTFRFRSAATPMLFAALVNGLAQETGHHPRLTVLRKSVICQLGSGQAGGVTMKDVGLARRICYVE
ncbi:MAG TPA: 4a-hydroxytetrahydrobiopterin dehydratase [Thermoanaerobaculia bacterium]